MFNFSIFTSSFPSLSVLTLLYLQADLLYPQKALLPSQAAGLAGTVLLMGDQRWPYPSCLSPAR